jgi:hypothetical protein
MTKTTEENLSQSKYAEHRNVTKGYIPQSKLLPPLKKVNKPYKIRREGSFVGGFK